MGAVLFDGAWRPISDVRDLLDLLARSYTRDKQGQFSSTGGGPGSGKDISGDDAALREIHGATTDENGQWKQVEGADQALVGIAHRQGFDAEPVKVPAEQFDAYVREGGHTEMFRGLTQNGEMSAADIHTQVRDGDYKPGAGIFGNGYYMAPDAGKARPFSDGTPGSLGRYALHRDAKTITFDQVRARYGEMADAPGWKSKPEPTRALLADYGRLAASMGFDAIHVPAGTLMIGGSPVGRDEYVILNRGALIAEVPG